MLILSLKVSLAHSYHIMKVSHPQWIQVQMSRSSANLLLKDSTQRHDSGADDQGDISSHDSDMIAYESNKTSVTIH